MNRWGNTNSDAIIGSPRFAPPGALQSATYTRRLGLSRLRSCAAGFAKTQTVPPRTPQRSVRGGAVMQRRRYTPHATRG